MNGEFDCSENRLIHPIEESEPDEVEISVSDTLEDCIAEVMWGYCIGRGKAIGNLRGLVKLYPTTDGRYLEEKLEEPYIKFWRFFPSHYVQVEKYLSNA